MKQEKKTAFIVGGTSGIGKDISLSLAKKGFNLILTGHSKNHIENTQKELCKYNIEQKIIQGDFSDFHVASFEQLAQKMQKAIEESCAMCICFGPFLQKPLEDTTLQEWQNQAFCNLALPGFLVSCAVKVWKKTGGKIILFGGTRTEAVRGFSSCTAYMAAKTGLSTLTKSTAKSYSKYGITCNAILPGFVETTDMEENTKKKLLQQNRPLVKVKTITDAIIFLLEQKNINGALLNIDSGWQPTACYNYQAD